MRTRAWGAALAILIACDGDPGASHAGPAPVPCPAPAPAVRPVDARIHGATGDGRTDDTAALQRAIDAVAGTGGTLWIPEGTYLVDATRDSGRVGLRLGSRMTLHLAPRAILKARPNAAATYSIVAVADCADVTILGGTLEGERDAHKGTAGEWGMGLTIIRSRNIMVQDITARECWGDGFYVTEPNSGITFCNVVADHNRRQGLSITGADGIIVRNSTFKNTEGTAPECGIDIEPNPGETVTNLQILDCTVTGNNGGGIAGGPPVAQTGKAFFSSSRIARNLVAGNRGWGILVSACRGDIIEDNIVRDTRGYGILLRDKALDMTIRGNHVSGSTKDGIYLEACSGTRVTGNTVTGNSGRGIRRIFRCGAAVSGNKVSGNGWF
jgi:parallel beta-helix repeat protein